MQTGWYVIKTKRFNKRENASRCSEVSQKSMLFIWFLTITALFEPSFWYLQKSKIKDLSLSKRADMWSKLSDLPDFSKWSWTPPTPWWGVHLQVRLRLLKNLKRKYGVYPPPTMVGGSNFIYWPPVKTNYWKTVSNLNDIIGYATVWLVFFLWKYFWFCSNNWVFS